MKKFLPKSINNPQGFTLIELLVVISIIAVLSVVGIVTYTSTQKSARDARRRTDIDAIANALEASKTSTGYVALTAGSFANGGVPTDSTTPQYSVCASDGTAAVNGTGYNPPSTWYNATPVANPTAATANCNSVSSAGGAAWKTVSTSDPKTGAVNWTICAQLEAAASTYYCKGNAQ